MRSAVDDELISRSPCKLPGASKESAPEREIVSVAQVEKLGDALPERQRIVPLLIFWCQLRQGEWKGLRCEAVDLKKGTLTIASSRTKMAGGKMIEKAPKSAAGIRPIYVPPPALLPLQEHVKKFVGPESDAYVVTGAGGGPLYPGTWYKAWDAARTAIGRPDLRPHDLRHSGLTLLAQTGATTAELMRRAGHSSPTAALRYQRATLERDRQIALAMADVVARNGAAKGERRRL